jgi:hypothetical protein
MVSAAEFPQAGPIRLTRRGRVVLLVTLLLPAIALGVLAAAPGRASAPEGPFRSAVVQPGDTLWSVAGREIPARDRFRVIDEIRRLNGIRDYTIHPGQRLILPPAR